MNINFESFEPPRRWRAMLSQPSEDRSYRAAGSSRAMTPSGESVSK